MKLNQRKTVLFTRYALAALGISAFVCGCASVGKLARAEAHYPKEKVNARGLFVENCAGCHGKDGRAKTFHGWILRAQNLTSPQWQETSSHGEIVRAIKTGPGAMPAFGKKMSKAEIEALADYVEALKPTN